MYNDSFSYAGKKRGNSHWVLRCCVGEKVSERVRPRILTQLTCSIPIKGMGSIFLGRQGLWKMISLVLAVLIFSLLLSDQFEM